MNLQIDVEEVMKEAQRRKQKMKNRKIALIGQQAYSQKWVKCDTPLTVEDIISNKWMFEGRNTLDVVKFEREGNESKGLMFGTDKRPVRWSFNKSLIIYLHGELGTSTFDQKYKGNDGRLKLKGLYSGIGNFRTYLIQIDS